ncbi:MAG: hypothetical protein RL664_1339, partial [Bacteroidota bacterium]
MKKLVPKETLAKVVGMNKRNPLLALLSSVTKLTKLNDLYDRIRSHKGTAFIEAFFQELQITIQLNEQDLDHIPETGGCVIVCNHPFGAIDGLALIQQIEKRRPDLKVMANFLLEEIPEIAPYFFSVNPFDKNVVQLKSERGLKRCMEHISNGGCLAIFPAGEVSTFQKKWSNVSDKKWQRSVMKLIQRVECPVVPVFFDGRNSRMFHLLGKVNPQLRTMALPSELFKKEGENIIDFGLDNAAMIPLNFARSRVDIRNEQVNPYIAVKAKDGIGNAALKDELTGIMRSIRRISPRDEDNFALNETKLLSNGFDQLIGVVNIAGGVIGFFSILVGGFGIANIMFVSVKERINIIGIQKSLGAKNYFILFQFLFEAVILSL